MAINRRTAMQTAAALAAAEAAAPGAVDAAPVNPMPEEIPAPPAIVEEVKEPETGANDLYQQIDKAYEEMEKGAEPTIVVTEPEKTKTEDKAESKETPSTPVEEPEIKTADKKDESKTPDETVKTPAETPATGSTAPATGRHNRRTALAAAKAAAEKQAREDAKEDAKNKAQGTPSTGSATPTVHPGYGTENKLSEDANWGNDDQAKAVKAFLDEHPTGSTWNFDSGYKNFGGCTAYAVQLMDIAYDGIATTNRWEIVRDRYQVRQYDIVNVGGHDIFVLEVLPEQNAIRAAEGNLNGKTFNEGIWSLDRIVSIRRPELAK